MKVHYLKMAPVAACLLSMVNAGPVTFFAEDLNGNTNARVAFPSATAARNSFRAKLIGVGTENIEGFSPGAAPSLNLNFPGAGTATLQGDSNAMINKYAAGTNGFGRYPTSGNQYVGTNSASGTGTGSPADGSMLLIGYINAGRAFSSVVFHNSDLSDYIGFDDMTVGSLNE